MNETQKESQTQRKLLSNLTENAQAMEKAFETIETAARVARNQMAEALLTAARIEAIRVEQAYSGRKADQLVETLEIRAVESYRKNSDLVTSLLERVSVVWDLVGKLTTQLERTVTDDGLKLDLMRPIPGVEYVDLKWICAHLGNVSEPFVRKLIDNGDLSPHHALEPAPEENDRPKHLWVKVKVEIDLTRYRSKHPKRAVR